MADLLLPEMTWNSLRVTGIVCDGDRTFPTEVPFVLAPACVLCAAPSLERPCETCGLPYCARCLPCPDCVATPTQTPSPRVAESIDIGCSTGSTREWVITKPSPNLYQEMLTNNGVICLEEGFLIRKPTFWGQIYIEDEVGKRTFGTCHSDFTRLCTSAICASFICVCLCCSCLRLRVAC